MFFTYFLKGLMLSASLIMAIGPQNAFVLRQGIQRSQVFLTALICASCDLIMMGAGVFGMSAVLAAYPTFTRYAAWAGAIFVTWYGLRALLSALKHSGMTPTGKAIQTPKAIILTALAFSFLNPHAILDTVILVGSIGAQQPMPLAFLLGAAGFSFIWFFGLAYGATKLAPFFARSISWRILDGLIALMMFAIAVSLIRMTLP
jgi:L-lysine exporter family protein LysE/ArgO